MYAAYLLSKQKPLRGDTQILARSYREIALC